MKVIKKDLLDKIDNPKVRSRIAVALGQGEQSIASACRLNIPNGTLTKWSSLEVISKETGTAIEDILEDVEELEPQK